ncbi:MAG: DMT family transporter [Rhodocyclaceae bacterium]|nr:DMT family transporter [Rhodocyclaceae bacterium]
MSPERLRGALCIAVSASAFGAMAIFARMAAAEGVGVGAVLFLRFTLAGLLLAGYMALSGRTWPRGRPLAILCGMGGIGYASQSFCFFSALGYASAGMVALLLYLHPFMVTLAAAALFGHRLGPVRLLCVVMAVGGTALTIGGDLHSEPLGLVLGVASAVIYSAYILVGSRVLESQEPLAAAAVVMLSASVSLGLAALATGPAFPVTLAGWLWVALIALLSTVVAMVFLFAGMRRLGPADAVTLSTLEPVVTFALAALFLGESISGRQLLGGAVVIAAVIWLAQAGGREAPAGP